MQFTYTFPPILRFGYDVITDAMAADAPYVPGQGARGRVDTWSQWSRWKRVSLQFLFNQTYGLTFNIGLVRWSLVLQTIQFHFILWRPRHGSLG